MSDPTVTAYLTKLLCLHGGRLERNRLSDLLSLPEEQIGQILQEEPTRFPQSAELVLARSPLRICTRYLRPGDQEHGDCERLHLCRHYLRGQCPLDRRPRCRFSHDVESEHNRAVLRANELSGLNEDEIKVLLFQNDNQLLPEICQQYKQDNCDQEENCTRLHVCSFFAQDGCNRRVCRRSHNLLNSQLLLTCSWLNQETIQNFQMLCVLKSIERQQAPREGSTNEAPRGARGISRGRGRGRPGYRRRAGSQDLLDSRRRERSNEGSHPRWRSSSRPPSQCSMGQRSGDEDYNDSDSSSDHGRYPRTRLDNLMDDWFTTSTVQSGKAQVRSVGVTPQEEIRSVRPNKGYVALSRADKPLTPVQQTEPMNSRLTSELSRASYSTRKADNDSSNAAGATPVELPKLYHPHPQAPYPSAAKGRPEVPPKIEQLVSYPTSYTGSGKPTTLKSVTSITSPQPSTISSTFSSSKDNPTIPSKRINALTSSLLNRQVHLSTGGSSSAEAMVSPSPTASNNSEFTSTKRPSIPNQKTDMELGKALGSSMAKLLIAASTPSKTTLYTTTEMSSITQPKPATSGHMGASSNLISPNVFVEADTPSRKLQANVKPMIKTNTTGGAQYSQTDEDFEFFCQSLKATNSTATKPQPPTTIPSVSPRKSLVEKTPEICLANIWMHCSLEGKCPNMHYYLPYRWQVFNGTDWDDLPNMENIEKAYSDPKIDRYQLINFQVMKSGYQPVRRLATPSSVTQPSEYVLTTEWCWYWKNESGTWTEYGKPNTENMSATIQSSDLETIYLADPTGKIPFTAGSQPYIIDYQEMKQRNTFFETEREVRRRPKFLDFQNVKMLRGSKKSSMDSVKQTQSDSSLKDKTDPPQSELEVVPENRYTKFILLHDSSEFTNIVAMFSKTVSGHTVKKVWRVENSNLWMLYNRQKDQMKKKNLTNTVDERQLFHGTNPADIDAICSQNFDQNICGTNGIAYGLGSYFARDASYSHKYSPPTSTGARTMIMAHVLVGDFTEGNPTLIRPPQKHGSSQRYDSCVDNKFNPSIFVVFEKDQVYPKYILEYKEQKTPCKVN